MIILKHFQEAGTATQFTFDDVVDKDGMYAIFKASYDAATGHSWDKGKFFSRAKDWIFFGDETGFTTVRQQRSGMWKLTGSAGNPIAILRGFHLLISESESSGTPVWGVVTEDIAKGIEKMGKGKFKRPSPMIVKAMIPHIPPEVFGHADVKVNNDGSLDYQSSDMPSSVKKFFIANKQYYKAVVKNPKVPLPEPIKKLVAFLI